MKAVLRTNKDCIKFLEALIWDGVPVSPFDKSSKVYKCKNGHYRCKTTKKYFTVTTGTVFENTKISLMDWFDAIYHVVSSRNGVSSIELAKLLEISQPAAWRLLQKIRTLLGNIENCQKLTGTVEADEFISGGLLGNMHYDKKLEAKAKGGYWNKIPVHGMIERDGNVVALVVPNTEAGTLCANILRYVKRGSTLYTDENIAYNVVEPFYHHESVVHSKGNYVSKENPDLHTNTIESFWNTLSRTLHTYVHVSAKHLQNYVNEAVYRHNTKMMKPFNSMVWALQNAFVV